MAGWPVPGWIAALLALGGLLAVSASHVGFLSDDFLLIAYVDRQEGGLCWERVAADLHGPWFGGAHGLYRPCVTASLALQLLLCGLDATWFHLANVAMLVTAAICTGLVVRLRFPQGPGWLAAAAGAVLLVHPAAMEPAHWILARTSGLEVMFSTAAMAAYAAFLYGRLRSRWPAFLAMALALGSKESAVTVALSLTAVDLLCARGSAAARVQSLRPFWILMLAYLLFRKLRLGVVAMPEGLDPGAMAAGFGRLAQGLLVPAGEVLVWPCAALLLVAGLVLLRAAPARLGLYLLWIAVLLLPTSHVIAANRHQTGRLVSQCLPALAFLLVEATGALRAARWRAPLLLALLAVWAAAAWPAAGAWRRGGALVADLQRDLLATAPDVAPGRPAAMLAFVQADVRLQLLQRGLWGLLVQRPFVPEDLPFASLESVLPRGPQPPLVDATPVAAVLAAGGTVCYRDPGGFRSLREPPDAAPEALHAVAGEPGRFAAPRPWLPFAATVAEVELPAGAVGCRLGTVGLPEPWSFAAEAAAPAPQRTFWFDLGAWVTPLALTQAGAPWPDLAVQADGEPAPDGTAVRLHRHPAPLPLATPLRGGTVALGEVAARLHPPAAGAMLYLLLPTSTVASPATADRPFELARAAREELGFVRAMLGTATVHYCWATAGGAEPPRRSDLDWFTLR